MLETTGMLFGRVQKDEAEAHGLVRGDLSGLRGSSALAVCWSTAACSPSSGQATNRRVEDGRGRKEEKISALFFTKEKQQPKVTGLGRA